MLLEEYTVEDAIAVMRQDFIEQGLEQGRGEDVRNLFKHGMSPDWIAETLNLPLDTVRQYLG